MAWGRDTEDEKSVRPRFLRGLNAEPSVFHSYDRFLPLSLSFFLSASLSLSLPCQRAHTISLSLSLYLTHTFNHISVKFAYLFRKMNFPFPKCRTSIIVKVLLFFHNFLTPPEHGQVSGQEAAQSLSPSYSLSHPPYAISLLTHPHPTTWLSFLFHPSLASSTEF